MKQRITMSAVLILLCVSVVGLAQTAEDVYYEAAEFYNARDYANAEELYSKVIEMDPEYVAAYGGRAMVYFETRRYDKALEDFTWVLERNPDNIIALMFRVICYSSLGRYEEALGDFDRVIRLEPEAKWPYALRGRYYYYELGKFDEALADFAAALEEDPEYTLGLTGRAETYREMGRYDEALFNIEAAMAVIGSDDPDLRYIRGSIYAAMGNTDAARSDLEAACRGDSLVYKDDACDALSRLSGQ
ncbi:MAG: tetratricopeptide repeat protein [Deltaproteobacteria bacterium]|nr:tetratricopeptide repeat protein [Candidatus Zymogenaceae bacterium]